MEKKTKINNIKAKLKRLPEIKRQFRSVSMKEKSSQGQNFDMGMHCRLLSIYELTIDQYDRIEQINHIKLLLQIRNRMLTTVDQPSPNKWEINVLIAQFWLSGLWILSLIFTASDADHLEHTNFFMFITLGIGSLAGGYASDILGRVFIFKLASVIWLLGSLVLLLNQEIGYIISAGSIGLLNNLTFVIIMENYPNNKNQYTIYVLIGWAASQITLGILFYFISKQKFFLLLFLLTLIYAISCFLFVEDIHERQNANQQAINNQQLLQMQNDERRLNRQNPQTSRWAQKCRKLIPHSLRNLIGGCLLMFVMQMFYYRTQFTLDKFGVELQLNTIIVGITQLTANLVFTKFINRFPRKLYLRFFLIVLTVLFIILIIFSNKVLQTLVQGIMRLFDTCIMIVLGVYLPELFDADERGKGTNYVMSFGVLGSALNSIILNQFAFWQLIFFLLIGFLATFCFKQAQPSHLAPNQREEFNIKD